MIVPQISRSNLMALSHGTWGSKSGTAVPTPDLLLCVHVLESERTEWCWAAVTLAVETAYKTAGVRQQCDIVSAVRKQDCCPHGTCNEDADLALALALRSHYADMKDTPGHQDMAYVKSHLTLGHPLAVRIQRSDGGHYVVVSGYLDAAEQYLWIGDPDYGTLKHCLFDEFLTNYEQDGYWHQTIETTGGTAPVELQEHIHAAAAAH